MELTIGQHGMLYVAESADMSYQDVTGFLNDSLRRITNSVVICGADQGVRYKEIFAGYKALYVPEKYVGCALTGP